jgi:NAD(P)-dependent dehydrogenase (short-subunit alcohol dehydrogenase family)
MDGGGMEKRKFRIGDRVKVVGMSPVIFAPGVKDELGTEKLFKSMLGKVYTVRVVDKYGNVELEPKRLNTVWVEPEWDRVVTTNLKGCYLCTPRAAQHERTPLGRHRKYRVGLQQSSLPQPFWLHRQQGRHRDVQQIRAMELGPYGIRVNCVAPGAIETERTKKEVADFAKSWSQLTPLRRIGTPDDVAEAVEFLLSDRASFIIGQTLGVDGGLFAQPRWPDEDYNP